MFRTTSLFSHPFHPERREKRDQLEHSSLYFFFFFAGCPNILLLSLQHTIIGKCKPGGWSIFLKKRGWERNCFFVFPLWEPELHEEQWASALNFKEKQGSGGMKRLPGKCRGWQLSELNWPHLGLCGNVSPFHRGLFCILIKVSQEMNLIKQNQCVESM